MKKPNRLVAHELAVEANGKYAQALKLEEEKQKIDRKLNVIKEKFHLPWIFFLTAIYLVLIVFDASVMAPLIRVFTVESMSLSKSWTPVFVGLYVTFAMAFAFFISKGFLRKWSEALAMDYDFAQLEYPDKVPSTLMRELQDAARKKFRLALVLFLVFIFMIVIPLCVLRNYYNASHQLNFRLVTPGDWTSILIPVVMAGIMFLASIYKEVVLKYIGYSSRSGSIGAEVLRLFEQAQKLGVEAIEYDFAAIEAYETTERSKELQEVMARYKNVSVFSNRQRTVQVKVLKNGAGVPHMQVQGMTPFDEIIFSTTGVDGITLLCWNKGDHLKKIVVDKYPLNGQRFDNGQTVVVEMDFLSGGETPQLKLA